MSPLRPNVSHKRAVTVDLARRRKRLRKTRSLDFDAAEIFLVSSGTSSVYNIPSPIPLDHRAPDMDTSRSYRVGSPALISLPFDVLPVHEIPQWDGSEFRETVYKTLKDANAYVCGQWIVKQFRPGNDVRNTPETLSIESDLSLDGQYDCWKAGFKKLRSLLDTAGLEQMLIEIIDRRATLGFSAGPILECTPKMFTSWQSFISIILDEIEERDWLSVDTVARELGIKHPFTVPTVIITTTDADNDAWRWEIIPRLRSSLPPGMDIDVLYASALSYTSGESSGESSDEEPIAEEPSRPTIYSTIADYSSVVQMGSSIGLHEPANSATVGAVIKLSDNAGNNTVCGLTNHHVVAKKRGLIFENCPIGHVLSPDHPVCHNGQVEVVAPSHPDHECLFNLTTIHRNDLICQVVEMTRAHRQKSRLFANAIKRLAEVLVDWEVLAKGPDQHFGTVWATSGYRICDNANYSKDEKLRFSTVAKANVGRDSTCLQIIINGRTLDFGLNWALIKVTPDRDLDEYILATPEHLKLRAGALAVQFTRIEPNKSYRVAKRGRTTGWTSGIISRIGSILKLRADSINVVPVDLTNRFGRSSAILAFGVFHSEKGKVFMSGGDSGSCVLLDEACRKATFVGLLFASNELARVSYMMPMDMVIKDIEHATRQTVIQPTWVEYSDRCAMP